MLGRALRGGCAVMIRSAAGAGSGTLAKMTIICEQVRVGIAGILANIAGHPVAVAAAPAAS